MIDLHTHSNASDGDFSPTQLVHYAVAQGLSCLALTDHNGIEGVLEAEIEAHKLGLHFIRGVELSAQHKTHLVGLFLKDLLPIHQKSVERGVILKERLAHFGYEIDETVASMRNARNRCIADLITSGQAKDKTEAVEKYLLPPYDLKEAIDLIHTCGGIAILAHPARLGLEMAALDSYLALLKTLGVDGMECYQSSQTRTQTEQLLKLSFKYEFLISGGSDFHGLTRPEGVLGHYGIPLEQGVIPDDILLDLSRAAHKR